MAQAAVFQDQLASMEERLRTVNRLMTTKAAIAQTPKQLVWTLNKAKLYRYIPVVPPEKRHPIPLLLIFALMNRPYILDLRPGHSFVEFMVSQGYDVYLLDWGVPGYRRPALEIRRLHTRIHAASNSQGQSTLRRAGVQHARVVHRRHSHHHLRSPASRRWLAQSAVVDRSAGLLQSPGT